MTSPTPEQETAGDSTMPSASTFAIHNKAMTHKPDMEAVLRAEIERLRSALRPFAEAYRAVKAKGIAEPWSARHGLAWEDFARAAELVPEDKS